MVSGETIGHYKILEPLGAGGMGEVFLALDTTLGRKVAIKLLPAQFTSDPERLPRFQQEASTASALNHPNIITIHEIGAAEGRQFITTEFIEGETLRQVMDHAGLTLSETLDIAAQVAAALEAAHEAGIAHRDIKPENIMIRRRDRIVKVLDFGLAKLTEKSADKRVTDSEMATRALVRTMAGVVMGTTYYMSPEQARGAPVDERTDIWSLGVVLYEMLSGQTPFKGETGEDVRASILRDEPAPLPAEVPEPIKLVVEKALRKNRDERCQTASEMLSDLRSLQTQAFDSNSQAARISPGPSTAAPPQALPTDVAAIAQTGGPASTQTASSAEYIAGAIKQHKTVAIVSLSIIVLAAAALVYFVRGRGVATNSINSIAVLPFVNANNDPNTEYFSDGVTESIINSLSQLPHTKVLARTTVFRYKGRETDPQRTGRELGVDALLTGRVLQQADNLTIQAELVRVADGSELWGGRYNKKLADIFALQNEIAGEISETLRVKLTSEDQKRVNKRQTNNVEAYQLYLKGKHETGKFSPDAIQKAIDYFNQAIAADPSYAAPYAGLSDIHSLMGHIVVPPREIYPRAKAEAEKALALDESSPEAHNAMGAVGLFYDWNFPAAEREFKRAIELNPNYAESYSQYSGYFKVMRDYSQEIAQARRGQELDPLSAFANMELGEAFYHARRYDEAINQITKTLDLDPNLVGFAYHVRARAYAQKKMYREAIADCQRWASAFHDDPQALASLGHVYASMGNRREAQQMLDKLQEISKQRYFSTYWIAVVYAGLGDNDRALQYLEKAFAERYFLMVWINSDPRFDSLRSDARFSDLVKRIGLSN
jgi:eukaryotic-like serine/threonine-protein kinase